MSKMPCSWPIRRAASSSAIPASGSPSETRSGPRIARARPSAAVGARLDRAGDRRLGDLARLAVVAGTHQPAGQADEDVRALRRSAARSGPAGRPRGARPAPPRCGPVSTGCSRSASGGSRPGPDRSVSSSRVERLAEPGDRLVAVAGVVGHPRPPVGGARSGPGGRGRRGLVRAARDSRLDRQAVLAAGRRSTRRPPRRPRPPRCRRGTPRVGRSAASQ